MVQDNDTKQEASNVLGKINRDIFILNNHLQSIKENDDKDIQKNILYIEQLNKNIQDMEIRESSPNSDKTSFTINKGESIIFCIRSRRIEKFIRSQSIHDYNILLYVALHEISHVACPEYGHTPLFKQIFRFFANEAVKIGIYEKEDFNDNPKEYCGMTIENSII
jgi:hypothetical protein